AVTEAVKKLGVDPASSQIAMLPQNYIKLEGRPAQQMLKLMDALEDHDGTRHRLVTCGALAAPARASFPERLNFIHAGLQRLLGSSAPDCVVIENLFHARHARSALVLGHARGVAVLAAVQAGL